MLRIIQFCAALTAWIFGIAACGDVIAMRVGLQAGSLYSPALWGWVPLRLAPPLIVSLLVGLAAGLAFTPFVGAISVWESWRAGRGAAGTRLDLWRSFIWGAGIIETAGCLIFVLNGIVLFVPAAVALLIAGVAELAMIWRDMERQPEPAPRRVARWERTHFL